MRILDQVRGGYDLYKKHPVQFLLGSLLLGLLNIALCFTLTGLHFYGMSFMAFKALRGEKPEIADAFKGFQNFVSPFLAGLVFVAGTLVFVVGYAVTGGLFLYACPLIAEQQVGAREALGRSFRYARRSPGRHILFFTLAAALGYLGGLPGLAALLSLYCTGGITVLSAVLTLALCVLGTFVTLPILFASVAVAYRAAAQEL
ncbi:MAG: hypothetical protein HYZ53_19145 [Planctomycetes bacterium]|nr:hypothetical protein [Planctomycetota bacterium]